MDRCFLYACYGNPFLAGELHMFQQGLTPYYIREDARSEAYEEHPCTPARDEEKECYHTACPSLGARRCWCSGKVNECTVSHRAVSFSTPTSSQGVTASFP